MADPTEIEKSPRLIRRGDIVKVKDGEQNAVVTEVQVVLRLSNGANDTYTVSERVVMGEDEDISIEELAAAAQSDLADRAAKD